MNKSNSIKNIAFALLQAQKDLEPILLNATNPYFKSKYPDAGQVTEKVNKAFIKMTWFSSACQEHQVLLKGWQSSHSFYHIQYRENGLRARLYCPLVITRTLPMPSVR